MHWIDPTADAAMNRLYRDKTPAAQKKDWGIIQSVLISQVPVIWTQAGRIGISHNANTITGLHDIEFGNATLWGGVHEV